MLNERGMELAQELADMPQVQKAAQAPAIATTENHYGHYAQAIGMLADMLGASSPRTGQVLAAEALRLAGGNGAGIDAAMFAMFGHAEYDPMARMFGGAR